MVMSESNVHNDGDKTVVQEHTETPELNDALSPSIACVTERGIPSKYWSSFKCYEVSSSDLAARTPTLRKWRAKAPQGAATEAGSRRLG